MEFCRICARKSSETKPIFSLEGSKLILDLIVLICPIKIEFSDDYPKRICKACLKILKSAQTLREQSVVSDQNFRKGKFNFRAPSPPAPTNAVMITIKEEPKSSTDEKICLSDDDGMESFNCERNSSEDENQELIKNTKNEYQCTDCSHRFKHKSNLELHIKKFHFRPKESDPSIEVKCHICEATIRHKTNLKRHIIQYHDPKLKYGCKMCSYRFKNVRQLSQHGSKVHEIANMSPVRPEHDKNKVADLEIFSCLVCKKKYIQKEDLEKHTKRHFALIATNTESGKGLHPANEFFNCDYCDKVFAHRSNLYRHIDQVHPDDSKFTCQYCGKIFRTKMMLYRHFEEAHPEEDWDRSELKDNDEFSTRCKICNQHFGGCRSRLERHLITQHRETLERVMQCDYCGKKYIFFSSLKVHVEFHVLKKRRQSFPYPCDKCKKRFNRPELLERHKKVHDKEGLNMCYLCGKVLSSKPSLELHIKRHEEVRPYPCPQCPVSFVCLNQLERHMLSHKETKDYVCNLCGKGFRDPEVYKRHLKRHAGLIERRFECTFVGCGKKFHQKFTLDNHILTHTKEKPHRCPHCPSAYSQKYDLTKHLKIHIGDGIYPCTLCSAAFPLQVELKKHYAVHYLK